MNIRTKMIWVVLPLLVAALLVTSVISSFSARSGMTRIAMDSLGFKAQELNKYMDNQWNLLVSNGLSGRKEYVDVARSAVASYSDTLIRSRTEVIIAVGSDGLIKMSTSEINPLPEETEQLKDLYAENKSGWTGFVLEDAARVGHAFYFEPFDWYIILSENEEAFSREASQIIIKNFIVLGISSGISLFLLLVFTHFLTRPLSRMVRAMRAIIGTGNLAQRVEVEYKDEIGELAHTFNLMIQELARAHEQIKEFAFRAVLAKKNEHKIRNIFQKYVPKDVIEGIFSHPESMLVGENRVVAILFSDIRSFTTISEGYKPDELVASLNRYFEIMVDIIMNRGGIIDKYIGDAIMAFFGAPVKHKDDAYQAVLVALEMQEALRVFNDELESQGRPRFKTGIGINYGVMTVGNIGSDRKMDYTVIGDMVNLGSRLEGLTKPYDQDIIFSESVYRKVKDKLPCRLVDRVVVKGKTQGEKIYTVAWELDDRTESGWSYHHAGLRSYYQQDFQTAKKYFTKAANFLKDDKVLKQFIGRCEKYIKEPPPPDWNGLEVLTSK